MGRGGGGETDLPGTGFFYRYGETITYVTRSGQPLSEEQVRTIKVGTPVNVHYVTEGDARILNRVEVDEMEVDDDGEIEIDD